jgi:hypothetical protein
MSQYQQYKYIISNEEHKNEFIGRAENCFAIIWCFSSFSLFAIRSKNFVEPP